MRCDRKVLFGMAAFMIVCGACMMLTEVLPGSKIDTVSRVMIAIGCVLIALYAVMRKENKKSPAYSGFGKGALTNTDGGVTFGDVAANPAAKASLMGLVDYIKNPEKYTSLGARLPKGVLLYGPPGTGKTLLARALAGEAGVPFFALSGSDFVHMYVGVGAGRVRELFANARKAGKCVIFIDEIDALGKRRSDTVAEERDQTLNALLSEMSGFNSGEGIIVVAATNRIEALDAALLRPGRFDRQIEVGLPCKNERYDILKLHSRNKPISEGVDLKKLADDTCAFSGAALESLLNEAAIVAAERKSGTIEKIDVEAAFVKTIAGADGKAAADPDERCAIAIHEAGHAVAMKRLMPDNKLKRISILSASKGTAGYNLAIPEEKTLMSKKDLEDQIMVLLAGRAAEILVGGDGAITTGASGDLVRAAELAGSMIMDLGMAGEPAAALRAIGSMCGGVSGKERECRELLAKMYERTTELLTNDIELLIRLTDKLLNAEILDEHEIAEVFEDI